MSEVIFSRVLSGVFSATGAITRGFPLFMKIFGLFPFPFFFVLTH